MLRPSEGNVEEKRRQAAALQNKNRRQDASATKLDQIMKNKTLNAVHVCKEFEEGRAQARPLQGSDRNQEKQKAESEMHQDKEKRQRGCHTPNLETNGRLGDTAAEAVGVRARGVFALAAAQPAGGQAGLRFSLQWLARSACLSIFAARSAVRSLAAKGALRLAERSRAGHLVEVRLPEEIRTVRAGKSAAGREVRPAGADNLKEVDFLETKELREAIHRREGGRCFYCLHRVTRMTRCLDHVVSRARNGSNSYRNVVSSCVECNSQKRERPAPDFLRWLFREGRLDGAELKGRQRALKALAAGKLKPVLPEIPRQQS
jgi:hypothetical protein